MTAPQSGCRIVRAPKTGRSSARWRSGRPNAASMSTSMRPAIAPPRRMKALNMGWAVQDRLVYSGGIVSKVLGPEGSKRAPPIKTALKMGMHVAGGTDSDQVAPYNPFVSLRWLLDGKVIDGTSMRGPEESPDREEALRMYSLNSAWFTFDEAARGSLEPGKYADLAVLSDDYLTVPVEKISELHSLLTLVGGKAVYGEGPFAALEGK